MYNYRLNSVVHGGPTGETQITKFGVAFHTEYSTYHRVKQITIYGRDDEYEMLMLINNIASQNLYHHIKLHKAHTNSKNFYMKESSLANFGPECEYRDYPGFNYTRFHIAKVVVTTYALSNLLIDVNRVSIGDYNYLLIHNSHVYDNFLIYAIHRMGIKHIFEALVSAGILTLSKLLKTLNPQPKRDTSDFHIVCNGEYLPACKSILSQFGYFRTMFAGQFNDNLLIIPDSDPKVVRECLMLAHRGKLEKHHKRHRYHLFMWLSLDLPALHLIEN